MATYLRATVTIPHNTGLPEDAVINTWSWVGNAALGRATDATNITSALNTFYTAIKAYLGSTHAWNSAIVDFVDMQDARPRVPFATGALALGTLSSTNNDLPYETALCVSMRGALVSGLNRRRRRGRVYIGPLQIGAGDNPQGPANAIVDTFATAAAGLLSATDADLAIYSPYTHFGVPVGEDIKDYDEIPSQLDDAFVPVEAVWVDNAWDTQRRRGVKATYRKTL